MTTPTTVELSLARETKGTYFYGFQDYNEARDSGLNITSLYIKKAAFNGAAPPAKIRITVEKA